MLKYFFINVNPTVVDLSSSGDLLIMSKTDKKLHAVHNPPKSESFPPVSSELKEFVYEVDIRRRRDTSVVRQARQSSQDQGRRKIVVTPSEQNVAKDTTTSLLITTNQDSFRNRLFQRVLVRLGNYITSIGPCLGTGLGTIICTALNGQYFVSTISPADCAAFSLLWSGLHCVRLIGASFDRILEHFTSFLQENFILPRTRKP